MSTKRARITDRNPLTATDGVIAGYEQVNKSVSQQDDNITSQQPSKSTSQNEVSNRDKNSSNLATEEVSNQGSQLVEEPMITSQEPDNLASEEVDDFDLGSNPGVNKSTSQQSSKLEIQEFNEPALLGDRSELDKLTSQQSDKLTSQQASKPTIRKATFQVDAAILEALDRYHLQLQVEMGRRNAPYKEILVEEAIAQWLERAAKSPDRAVKSLLKRQEQR